MRSNTRASEIDVDPTTGARSSATSSRPPNTATVIASRRANRSHVEQPWCITSATARLIGTTVRWPVARVPRDVRLDAVELPHRRRRQHLFGRTGRQHPAVLAAARAAGTAPPPDSDRASTAPSSRRGRRSARRSERSAPRSGGRCRATPSVRRAAAAAVLCASALAITTRCFSPPLSVLNARPSNWPVPVAASARRAMARSSGPSSAKAPRWGKRPISTMSRTLKSNGALRLLRNERRSAARSRGATIRRADDRRASPSRRRTVHPAEQLEECRLAGSVRSENADQFAALDVQADIAEDDVIPRRASVSPSSAGFGCAPDRQRTSSRLARLARASIGERHLSGPEHVGLSPRRAGKRQV